MSVSGDRCERGMDRVKSWSDVNDVVGGGGEMIGMVPSIFTIW